MDCHNANDKIIISNDEKNLLSNPYYMVCSSGNHRPLSNLCIVDCVTVDIYEGVDHIPHDINRPDVEDIEDNNDNFDPCDVEFGKLVLEDFFDPSVYDQPIEGDDASLNEGHQLESQRWKTHDPKEYIVIKAGGTRRSCHLEKWVHNAFNV